MRRRNTFLFHLAYWLLYESTCLFFLFISKGEPKDFPDADAWTDLLVFSIAAVLSFYATYYLLFPRYLAKKRATPFIIGALVVCLASAGITAAVTQFLFYTAVSFFLDTSTMLILLAGFFVCSLVNAIAATALRGALHWYHDIRVKEAMERKKQEAEIQTLKSRLPPHFLFNTLNNIDVLIGIEPAKASQYLQQLSRMLRFLLYRGQQGSIHLSEEIAFIRDYIQLESIRKADRHIIRFTVDDPDNMAEEYQVLPLIFLPFIENACKYAVTGKEQPAVDIHMQILDGSVVFNCFNTCSTVANDSTEAGGLGLKLTKQRLDLGYHGLHHLDISHTAGTFTVHCRIKLTAHA